MMLSYDTEKAEPLAGGVVNSTQTPQNRPRPRLAAGAFGQPQTSAINPNADLRGQQITASPVNPQLTNATNQAAATVAKGPNYTPYAATTPNDSYTTSANKYLNTAGGVLPGYTQQLTQAGQRVQNTGYGPAASASINPTVTSGLANQAFTLAGNLSGGSGVNFSGATTNAQHLLGQGLNSLYTAPNRSDLASKAFNLLQQDYQPQFETDLRNVGKKAAAFGRVGAGMTTSDLGDVAQRKNEFFARRGEELANDAAAQEMADRLNAVGATNSAFGTLSGTDISAQNVANQAAQAGGSLQLQGMNNAANLANLAFNQQDVNRQNAFTLDSANNNLAFNRAGLDMNLANAGLAGGNYASGLASQTFGMGQGLRNEDRTDQTLRNQFETGNWNANLGGLNALSGLEGQRFGQNLTSANELRGERGYQNDLSNQAFNRQLQQVLTEDSLLNNAYNRQGQNLNWLSQGFTGNPAGLISGQAAQANANAQGAFGGVGDLLQQYFMNRAAGTGATGTGDSRIIPNVALPQGRTIPITPTFPNDPGYYG